MMRVAYNCNVLEGVAYKRNDARQVVGCTAIATAIRSGDASHPSTLVLASRGSLWRLSGMPARAVIVRGGGVTPTALAVFLLACLGFVEVVAVGKLFSGVRTALLRFLPPVGRMVQCPMCLGVWVGALAAWLGLFPLEGPRWLAIASGACVSSAWCWSMHVVLVRLGSREL